ATPASTSNILLWDNVGGGDGAGCVINPLNPDIQYCSSQEQVLYRTTNNWNNISSITPNWGSDTKPFIGVIALDPSSPNLLYAGTNYLWQYNATNNTWTSRLGNRTLAGSGETVTAIDVAPTNGQRLYTGSSDGQFWTTSNRGSTWTRLDASPLPVRAITALNVHPTNDREVLIGLSGTGSSHLYRASISAGGAVTFTNISGTGATGLPDFPLNSITRDPSDPANRIYVATDGGVFFTSNGGTTWSNATAPLGLPNVQCNEIKYVPGTGYLNVATFGRGMWRLPLPSLTASPSPSLRLQKVTTHVGGQYQVRLTITNGGGPAANVRITSATLKAGTTTRNAGETMPITVGAIASGQAVNRTVTFTDTGLPVGTAAVLTVTGTYSGGVFNYSSRVTLP
ncbi:MAG: hypothetical protein SFU56_08315, partial [Capsulimonadales bacterium]|nr:hypothetical protein [Capsulimonadales bacterium]